MTEEILVVLAERVVPALELVADLEAADLAPEVQEELVAVQAVQALEAADLAPEVEQAVVPVADLAPEVRVAVGEDAEVDERVILQALLGRVAVAQQAAVLQEDLEVAEPRVERRLLLLEVHRDPPVGQRRVREGLALVVRQLPHRVLVRRVRRRLLLMRTILMHLQMRTMAERITR